MVLVPQQHFVPGFERQSVVDDIVRFARVPDKRDLVGRRADLRGDSRSRVLEQLHKFFPVAKRAVNVHVARQLCRPVRNRPRCRAEIGRIHRNPLFGERKVIPDQAPVWLAVNGRVEQSGKSHRRGCRDTG
jgi:hypothetical protein